MSLKTVIIYLLMQWEDLNQNQFWSQTNNNPGTLAGSVTESKLLLKVALSQKILENFHIANINIPNHYPEQKI